MPRGQYNPKKIERLRVRLRDGSSADLYTVSAGYFEGYQFDVYSTLEALLAAEAAVAAAYAAYNE